MAPNVQLLYFDGRGRGEIIRIILTYGGVEFEDKRVSFEEWPQVKPSKKGTLDQLRSHHFQKSQSKYVRNLGSEYLEICQKIFGSDRFPGKGWDLK